ncbi:MAG: exodeoxyribonuclease V subunit beta [Candidatus Sedimenticola endophacoides]
MKRLDLTRAPLEGSCLIEASAGTGKTYTIAGLYLRLILEAQLPVERILVVTYTKAATAELRERLRARLVGVRQLLEQEEAEEIPAELRKGLSDPLRAARLLSRALLDFDRAAVFTIHAFCQRVLQESAFESARPFELEMTPDPGELIQAVVDDYWRLEVQAQSPGFIDFLQSAGISPDALASRVSGWLNKPYMEVRGPYDDMDYKEIEDKFNVEYGTVCALWEHQRQTITETLHSATGLNGNTYRKASMEGWFRSMDAYLSQGESAWFDKFDRFTSGKLADSRNKGREAPQHPFFDHCGSLLELRGRLRSAYRDRLQRLIAGLIRFADAQLALRKDQAGVQSYDDMLLNLERALDAPGGERLAAVLRGRYAAALIDEFQDTDPVQYGIFRRVYADAQCPCYFVGDPKQAIYSFRGADIFAYLRAAQGARNRFTLDVNWRSAPQLIAGFNALFRQPHNSFFFSRIHYPEAHSAPPGLLRREVYRETQSTGAPLRFALLPGELTKEAAREYSVQWCAGEIRRLLAGAAGGRIHLGERPLRAGDIAVLVRSHYQGGLIKQALGALGVHSVVRSQDNIFASAEALELERVLRAVAAPGNEPVVRAALLTGLIGLDGHALDALTGDAHALEAHHARFRAYHQMWREQGFFPMFRRMLHELELPPRLREEPEGERRITNLLHLGELLHREERARRPSLEGLVKWLSHRRAAENLEDEEHQLRLESDEALVQIVTIHKSKGLQYPVVFCPFVWDAWLRSADAREGYRFHDPGADYRPVLELGSERFELDRVRAVGEELAEELRLLYVALTRARERCYLAWGKVNKAGESALAWLLHPPGDPLGEGAVAELKRQFSALSADALGERLHHLAEVSGGAVSIDAIGAPRPPEVEVPGTDSAALPPLSCRRFSRSLEERYRITSFSALAAHAASPELPDHDAHGGEAGPEVGGGGRDIFHFPRGARPGSCLHAIFEEIDFAAEAPHAHSVKVEEKLAAFGLDPGWAPVVNEMLRRVLDCELAPGIRLRGIPPHKRLVEMAFYYPLAGIDPQGLRRLLQAHGVGDTPELAEALSSLRFGRIEGYLKGFIDLVFEADGRFYLLDYKSNWLGGSADAYTRPRMSQAMAREYYFLQYLLYTLALHRLLKRRLRDYDYERHLGGVFYLFLRGIDPEAPGGNGIWHERPRHSLIEALDGYIATGEEMA